MEKELVMKFSKFDKSTLKSLRSELDEVLKKYGAESNLEISTGGIKFSSGDCEIKINVKVKGAQTFADKQLIVQMEMYNMKPEGPSGKVLTSYNSKNHKYPWIYTQNGKSYKTDTETASMLFAA